MRHSCTWNLNDDENNERLCGATACACGGGGAAPAFALCSTHLHAALVEEPDLCYDDVDDGDGIKIVDGQLIMIHCGRPEPVDSELAAERIAAQRLVIFELYRRDVLDVDGYTAAHRATDALADACR